MKTHAHVPSVPLSQMLWIGDVDLLQLARLVYKKAVIEVDGWRFRPVTRMHPFQLSWHPDAEQVPELEGAGGGVIRVCGEDICLRELEDPRGVVVNSEEYEEIVCATLTIVRRPWAILGYVRSLGQYIEHRPAGAERFEQVLSHYDLEDPFTHGGFEFVRFL